MEDDDKTVIMPPAPSNKIVDEIAFKSQIKLKIVTKHFNEIYRTDLFQQTVRVGRAADNDLILPFSMVSRYHFELNSYIDEWYIKDLDSANGTIVNGEKITQSLNLTLPITIQLGDSELYLELSLIDQPTYSQLNKSLLSQQKNLQAEKNGSDDQRLPFSIEKTSSLDKQGLSKELVRERLLGNTKPDDVGDYTKIVRELIHEDRSKRIKNYRSLVFLGVCLLCICLGLLVYQQLGIKKSRQLAIDLFYDIKTMELGLAKAEINLETARDNLIFKLTKLDEKTVKEEQEKLAIIDRQLASEREKIKEMRGKYKKYLKEVHSLDLKLPTAANYEKNLIMKVAGEFGESDLEINNEFIKEVKKYINYWKKTSRLQKSIDRLEKNNYKPIILSALDKRGISNYFIYLPLQESDFNFEAIGPETRFGIAKGAWQFLDGTGREFGLKTGSLVNSRVYDRTDERFDFEKSSQAGAKYLKYIYSTEAQASGLLVMAAYNYGHNRVRHLIRSMPESPRERNFWKFTQQHTLPQETYDYVFYIFSAAVIGENPKYFGFSFEPVLMPE